MISKRDRHGAFRTLIGELVNIDRIPAVRSSLPEYGKRLGVLNDFYLVEPSLNSENNLQFDMFWKRPNHQSVTPSSLKIYPYFPEDASLHSVLSESGLANGSSYAVYHRPNNQIFFNLFAHETLRFVASAFIHELGHALTALHNNLAMSKLEDSLEERIDEEVDMRTFDYNFALALGGLKYADLFNKGVYYTKKARERSNFKNPPDFAGSGVALDLCFGSPLTEQGKRFRDLLFQLYCELANADMNMKGQQKVIWKRKIVSSSLANFQA